MKEREQPSSARAGGTDPAPARIPLYCFPCRHTFGVTLPTADAPVKGEDENSARAVPATVAPCPRCGRTTDLYRIHAL